MNLSHNRPTPIYGYYTLGFHEACSQTNFKSNLQIRLILPHSVQITPQLSKMFPAGTVFTYLH